MSIILLRRVLAVGAGFFTTSILSLAGDYALRELLPGSFAPDGRIQDSSVFGITLGYSAVSGVLGGYVAARIAIERPMLHAAVLGGTVLISSALPVALLWNTAPAWYHVATLAMVLPAALVGGKIREFQMRHA